jgi:hypothetical protein
MVTQRRCKQPRLFILRRDDPYLPRRERERELADFVSIVLADTENTHGMKSLLLET